MTTAAILSFIVACLAGQFILVYHQTYNIRRNLLGNWIVFHPYVNGASPVGAAPNTSQFSTKHIHCTGQKTPQDETINIYRKFSNIICALEGNKIIDHSGGVGASPAGAAPTTSSLAT